VRYVGPEGPTPEEGERKFTGLKTGHYNDRSNGVWGTRALGGGRPSD